MRISGYFCDSHGGGAAEGGAQNDRDAMRVEDGDAALEPAKIEMSLFGLHAGPRKFGDANVVDAGCRHGSRIFFPEVLGGLVGVVIDAEERRQAIEGGLCRGSGLRKGGRVLTEKETGSSGAADGYKLASIHPGLCLAGIL